MGKTLSLPLPGQNWTRWFNTCIRWCKNFPRELPAAQGCSQKQPSENPPLIARYFSCQYCHWNGRSFKLSNAKTSLRTIKYRFFKSCQLDQPGIWKLWIWQCIRGKNLMRWYNICIRSCKKFPRRKDHSSWFSRKCSLFLHPQTVFLIK